MKNEIIYKCTTFQGKYYLCSAIGKALQKTYTFIMKKITTLAMIAACAMMVFSCKNNGKEEEKALENAAGEAVEAVEDAAGNAGRKARKAAKDVENAAKDAIDRADEAVEKLDDIIPAAAAGNAFKFLFVHFIVFSFCHL